jgi:C4-dicarboxylate transporter DctM subunit
MTPERAIVQSHRGGDTNEDDRNSPRHASVHVVAETFLSALDEFTLVAIPMFVMMGAAIGSSPAGRDLYEALDRWLYRLPGGLAISNIGACAIFAALTGSSPACCAAIGKMGIPEMRRRGYPDEIATGSICAGGTLGILIPPSVTFILYGIATETSIGRLFIAGVLPGIMLTGLFILWTLFAIWRRGFRSHAIDFRYSWKEKFSSIPKITPFVAIVVGVMYVLYGGIATPSEAAGVGAGLCLVLAVVIYRAMAARSDLDDPARHDAGIGDDSHNHRRLCPVRLHAHVALSDPDAGPGHRRSAR